MIYCIEDDGNIRDIEVYTLNSMGFQAKGFATSEDFFNALEQELPELILLDIMLPEKDGEEILKALKKDEKTKHIPIIMATAKSAEFDKVKLLDLGADDYMVKPFGMMEMVSRVRAVLRRSEPSKESNILQVAGITLNATEYSVSIEDKPVELTLKEFELLRIFMLHPRVVFTRDQLLNRIWGDNYYGETRTVDAHIKTLRKKLGEWSKVIKTVHGVGYSLEE